VFLLLHPVVALVFKQKLCHSFTWWFGSVFFLLSFSGSCLLSSYLSEVWQFKFECCPQVQDISSVVHQVSCFGVGFLLCLFTLCLFLCLAPFSVATSVIHQLAPCCQCVVMVLCLFFQFCRAVWLWMLLTGSGDELCGLLPALCQAVAYHPSIVGLPF
jgi:hypothetical protein